MTEDDDISRAWCDMHSDEPDVEQPPECACGAELVLAMERRTGVCGFCADAVADLVKDAAE